MYTWNDGSYLAHHGIKGQKWGVRRFQNKDGSYTAVGRKRRGFKSSLRTKWDGLSDNQKKAIKVGAALAVSALALYGSYKLYKYYGSRPSGILSYGTNDKLKDVIGRYNKEDFTIPKYTSLQRVSSNSFEDLRQKGHIYVSYKFRDNMFYKSSFRREINHSGEANFVHKIEPKTNLKIASTKTLAEEYLRLYPNQRDNIFREVIHPYSSNDAYGDDPISKIISDQRRNLCKALSDKGYSGFIDVVDASKRKGMTPLVIFDPDKYVTDSGSRKIGSIETFVARILE